MYGVPSLDFRRAAVASRA